MTRVALYALVACLLISVVSARFKPLPYPSGSYPGRDPRNWKWDYENRADRTIYVTDGRSRTQGDGTYSGGNDESAYLLHKADLTTGKIYEDGPDSALMEDFQISLEDYGYNFECLTVNPVTGNLYAISTTVLQPADGSNLMQFDGRYSTWMYGRAAQFEHVVVEINPVTGNITEHGTYTTFSWRSYIKGRGAGSCTCSPNGNFYIAVASYNPSDMFGKERAWNHSEISYYAYGAWQDTSSDIKDYQKNVLGKNAGFGNRGGGIVRWNFETGQYDRLDNSFVGFVRSPMQFVVEYYPEINNFVQFHVTPFGIHTSNFDSESDGTQINFEHLYSSGPSHRLSFYTGKSNWYFNQGTDASMPVYNSNAFGAIAAAFASPSNSAYSTVRTTNSVKNLYDLSHIEDHEFMSYAAQYSIGFEGESGWDSGIPNYVHKWGCLWTWLQVFTMGFEGLGQSYPNLALSENLDVRWAPHDSGACNMLGMAVAKRPSLSLATPFVTLVDDFSSIDVSNIDLGPVDTLLVNFTQQCEHCPVEAQYNLTMFMNTSSTHIGIVDADGVTLSITQCDVVQNYSVQYPVTEEARVMLQHGEFTAYFNITLDWNATADCRCGAGIISHCDVSQEGAYIQCDPDGSNVMCSHCKDGYAGHACDVDTIPPVVEFDAVTYPEKSTVDYGTVNTWTVDTADIEYDGTLPVQWLNQNKITGYDNTPNAVITFEYSMDSPAVFPIGETLINVTCDDGSEQTVVPLVIIVADLFPAVISCDNVVIQAEYGVDVAENVDVEAGITIVDNHPDYSISVPAADSYPVGTTEVGASVTDWGGFVSTCLFTVTVVDYNECVSGPCQNNGTCVDQLDDSIHCDCLDGFTGVLCEDDIDDCASSPCDPDGTSSCFDLGAAVFECKCMAGYGGEYCELEISDFCQSSPCDNNGICEGTACECADDFIGEFCHIEVSSASSDTYAFGFYPGQNTVSEAELEVSIIAAMTESGAHQSEYELTIEDQNGYFVVAIETFSTATVDTEPLDTAAISASVQADNGGTLYYAEDGNVNEFDSRAVRNMVSLTSLAASVAVLAINL